MRFSKNDSTTFAVCQRQLRPDRCVAGTDLYSTLPWEQRWFPEPLQGMDGKCFVQELFSFADHNLIVCRVNGGDIPRSCIWYSEPSTLANGVTPNSLMAGEAGAVGGNNLTWAFFESSGSKKRMQITRKKTDILAFLTLEVKPHGFRPLIGVLFAPSGKGKNMAIELPRIDPTEEVRLVFQGVG